MVVLTTGNFLGDGHLRDELAHFELKVDDGFLADAEIDAGADDGLEARLLRLTSCGPRGSESTRKLPEPSVAVVRVAPVSRLSR